jgi:hypothetical protein
MTFASTDDAERIIERQRLWARGAGLPSNRNGTGLAIRDDSLYQALTPEVIAQLAAAPGGELRKIHSFRSSTALALNVFLPWKSDPGRIGTMLGGKGLYSDIAFESEQDTGISKPYLDVLITGDDIAIAIESKFVEPYDDHSRSTFSEKYFDSDELWTQSPNLEPMARRFSDVQKDFERLDAAQLLKHAMGLINRYEVSGFLLVYAWYELDGQRATKHRSEISAFTDLIGDSFGFQAITYQELFSRLIEVPEPSPGYIEYLADRYFMEQE